LSELTLERTTSLKPGLTLDTITPLLDVIGSVLTDQDVILDTITLACGVAGSLLAFFGEPVRKRSNATPGLIPRIPRLISRITRLGWVSMGLLVIAFITGVWSRADSEVYQQSLLTQLSEVRQDTRKIFTNLPPLIDPQLDSLVIRQEVQDNPSKEPGNRNNKTVTFYVDVKQGSSVDKSKLFSRIKKVTYHLNPDWFHDKPIVEVDNITEDFRYSIGVWGSTRFDAEIETSDPVRRVVRGGYIDTNKTAIFE
jgi:hypothetical protein